MLLKNEIAIQLKLDIYLRKFTWVKYFDFLNIKLKLRILHSNNQVKIITHRYKICGAFFIYNI